jgi:hypothetical protein
LRTFAPNRVARARGACGRSRFTMARLASALWGRTRAGRKLARARNLGRPPVSQAVLPFPIGSVRSSGGRSADCGPCVPPRFATENFPKPVIETSSLLERLLDRLEQRVERPCSIRLREVRVLRDRLNELSLVHAPPFAWGPRTLTGEVTRGPSALPLGECETAVQALQAPARTGVFALAAAGLPQRNRRLSIGPQRTPRAADDPRPTA